MAKAKEFVLPPGRLWPNTPSGNPLEIEIFGATGEYKAGKTIIILSIAPGVHPEGHPFAGQPRTLYLDHEKSGGCYGGTGCKRIDVPTIMAGSNIAYTPLNVFEWFVKVVDGCKPGQYDVIAVDPVTDIESGLVEYVKKNCRNFGLSEDQVRKAGGLLWGAVKDYWKQVLLKLSTRCKTFAFTAHLRDVWQGNAPTGKREPKGKDTLMELASLYLWLERKADDKGIIPAAPSAMVLKERVGDTRINVETGELEVISLLPPRLPVATVHAIRGYIANPADYGKLKVDERVIEKAATEEELLRLKLATAEASRDEVNARLSLVDRQQQLTAIRQAAAANAPQATDRTAATQQAATEKRQTDAAIAAANASVVESPKDREERAANVVHRAAAAQLESIQAEGERLLAAAEGDHGKARDVAAEVQQRKEDAKPLVEMTPPNARIDLFKSLLGQVGYTTDPIVKANVTRSLEIRGSAKFSQLHASEQDNINNWLGDLAECRRLATMLGLDDAKLEPMLSKASVKRIEHLVGPMAILLKDKFQQALKAREGSNGGN